MKLTILAREKELYENRQTDKFPENKGGRWNVRGNLRCADQGPCKYQSGKGGEDAKKMLVGRKIWRGKKNIQYKEERGFSSGSGGKYGKGESSFLVRPARGEKKTQRILVLRLKGVACG